MIKKASGKKQAIRLYNHASQFLAVVEDRGAVFLRLANVAMFLMILFSTSVTKADDLITKDKFHFSLPQQRADRSLTHVAEQANITLIFPFDKLKSHTAKAINGEYSVKAVLEQLLTGTGYEIVSMGSNGHLSIVLTKESLGGIEVMHKLNKIAATVMSMAAATTVATSVSAQQASTENESNVVLEEIVVQGIRSSLKKSSDIKRASKGIVDAITAEDLGKFPDINVAESLARITGVAVTRTRGGEGQFVTVRGLGEEFNAVTYNGRILATENNGREFSFDVIASELISGAEVYKSPTAAQGDGSLGGRVNIRTARPLDKLGFSAAASISTQYEELADEFGPRATAIISNTNEEGTFGFNASVSYQDRSVRTDVAESIFLLNNIQRDANGLLNIGLDQNGDGFNDTTGAVITNTDVRVNAFAPSVSFSDRERIGGTVALQFRPNDNTDILIDALYTNFDSPGRSFGYSYFPSAQVFTGTNAQINEFNQAVAFEIEPFALDLVSREQNGEAETVQLGFNIEQVINDRLTLTGDVSYSKADGNRDNFGSAAGSGTFYVVGFPEGPRLNFDASNGLTPNATIGAFNIANDPSTFRSVSEVTADDVRLHFARNDTVDVEDEILSFKGDGVYAFSETQTLKFGYDYINREKTNTSLNNVATQGATGGYRIPVALNSPDLVPNFLQTFDDSFLSTAPGNFPRVFPFFTVSDFERARADAGFAQELIPVFDPNRSSVVEEEVIGAYFEFDTDGQFGSLPYDFNFGVRFAYTDLTSQGSGGSLAQITQSFVSRDAGTGLFQANQDFTIDPASSARFQNDYFDVLPSVNFALDLSDSLKLRLGASRSLSRPTLTDLSTQFSITSNNPFGEQVVSANPLLEAIRSNNFDASLEWYGEAGNQLSAAIFYKDISDFVTSQVTTQSINVPRFVREPNGSITALGGTNIDFLVSSPQNGDTAEILGLELGGQYFFANGFGIAGNLTLTDSESVSGGRTTDLENISDVSWNASVFYEKDSISARLSVNSRSDYLIGQTVEGGLDEFGDDFTQVDLSVSYDVTDHLTVFFDGINVTNEEVIRISEFPNSRFLESFEENGARYVFGLRGNY